MTTSNTTETTPESAPAEIDAFRDRDDNGANPYRVRIHVGGSWLFVRTKDGSPTKYANLQAACSAGRLALARSKLLGTTKS